MNFNFQPYDFVTSLPVMGKGMLGIFVVIALIIIVISLLAKIGNKNNEQ